MRMHMPHRLPAVAAGVEDNAVPAGVDALGDGDLMGRRDELAEQSVARAGQRCHVREVLPRDHQDVRRRLRADVTEGDDPLPVKHNRGGDLSGSDPAEQTVWHSTIIVAFRRRPAPATPPGIAAAQASGHRLAAVDAFAALSRNRKFAGTSLITGQ
jgi:hypothetical protein